MIHRSPAASVSGDPEQSGIAVNELASQKFPRCDRQKLRAHPIAVQQLGKWQSAVHRRANIGPVSTASKPNELPEKAKGDPKCGRADVEQNRERGRHAQDCDYDGCELPCQLKVGADMLNSERDQEAQRPLVPGAAYLCSKQAAISCRARSSTIAVTAHWAEHRAA